jgi:hypothetical protein
MSQRYRAAGLARIACCADAAGLSSKKQARQGIEGRDQDTKIRIILIDITDAASRLA